MGGDVWSRKHGGGITMMGTALQPQSGDYDGRAKAWSWEMRGVESMGVSDHGALCIQDGNP